MLKKLLLSVTAVACMFPAFAQHQRRVLIEELTNASCPPCASQNPAFNATVAANINFLTPIKYQTNWPGFDPMNQQNPTEVASRVAYYGVTGVPNGRQNGTLEIFPMTSYTAAIIQAAYNTLTPVTMTLSHSLTADYDSILIEVTVKSDSVLTGALRLRVAVIEEEILFDAPPGSTNEKDFYQVMRKMLPNADGTATGDFAAGETKTYSFAWPIAYAYNLNELGAVAFLQTDGTKEVYQSAISHAIGGIPDVGVTVPGAFSFNCTSGISPKFTLTNTGLGNLSTATLRYRVNGGAWVDYAWMGDLAPDESEVITLTDVVIAQSGTTKLDIEVRSSNNGIQTNLINAISTVNTRSLLDAPSAIPFKNDFQTAVSALPADWTVVNPSADGWKQALNAGTNRSARCNFYDIPEGGLAYLTSPKIDLTAAAGPTSLRFDHAYRTYNATFFDSLRIEVSTDCGVSWSTIFHNGKDGLATVATASTTAFTPSATQWRANQIDITSFNGNAILIRFVGESGFGNNLWIDNVNVSLTTGVEELPLDEFVLAPNPTKDVANVRFSLTNPGSIRLLVFDAIGAMVQSHNLGDLVPGTHNFRLDPVNLTSGSYRVVLQGNEGTAQIQWIVLK